MYNLKERILLENDLYQNRTVRYLVPLLKSYGNEFIDKFNLIKSKSYAIGDYGFDTKIGENIFCICEINNWRNYSLFIDFLKKQNYYVSDYIFSIQKNLHCFVIKFPYPEIIDRFIEGKYSTMLSQDDIDRYYLKTYKSRGIEYYTPVYSILSKKKEYEHIFLETLKEDFGTVDIVGEFEYDYPPIMGMEILNYDENGN